MLRSIYQIVALQITAKIVSIQRLHILLQ